MLSQLISLVFQLIDDTQVAFWKDTQNSAAISGRNWLQENSCTNFLEMLASIESESLHSQKQWCSLRLSGPESAQCPTSANTWIKLLGMPTLWLCALNHCPSDQKSWQITLGWELTVQVLDLTQYHDCLALTDELFLIQNEPFVDAEYTLFTDGSSFVKNGVQQASYAVVTLDKIVWAKTFLLLLSDAIWKPATKAK